MINRAAARDLYDVANMIRYALFDESEQELLRKCVIFYAAISAKEINKTFDISAIDALSKQRIKTDLLPVIRRKDGFNLEAAKEAVKNYLKELMVLKEEEKEFLQRFDNKEYLPELLFQEADILERIRNHPMALWKTR